jgi:hypothetical protein
VDPLRVAGMLRRLGLWLPCALIRSRGGRVVLRRSGHRGSDHRGDAQHLGASDASPGGEELAERRAEASIMGPSLGRPISVHANFPERRLGEVRTWALHFRRCEVPRATLAQHDALREAIQGFAFAHRCVEVGPSKPHKRSQRPVPATTRRLPNARGAGKREVMPLRTGPNLTLTGGVLMDVVATVNDKSG